MTDEIRRAPQGQVVTETPETVTGFAAAWGEWGQVFDDPELRYGKLRSSQAIPIQYKLEMLRDPVVALCQAFLSSALVRPHRVVHCDDSRKRDFYERLFRQWEREFALQAAMAVALGGVGMVKKYRFRVPPGVDWDSAALPFVVTGFDQLHPIGTSPRFDGAAFEGIDSPSGRIDRFYSLWLTVGRERAFGSYWGAGRCDNVYKDWWIKHFSRDLYIIGLQKDVNRVVKVEYPPGKTEDGRDHKDIALEIGNNVRGGATVAIPSSTWEELDAVTGLNRSTGRPMWAVDFLASGGQVSTFLAADDHHDRKMSMGWFLPPQAVMDVVGGDLGGPTSADKLSEIAEKIVLMDAADIDLHLNRYVIAPMDRLNFPPDSAPVEIRTQSLHEDNRRILEALMMTMLAHPSQDPSNFDLNAVFKQFNVPLRGGKPLTPREAEVAGQSGSHFTAPVLAWQLGSGSGSAEGAPITSDNALPLPPVPTADEIADSWLGLADTLARLRQMFPELFDA